MRPRPSKKSTFALSRFCLYRSLRRSSSFRLLFCSVAKLSDGSPCSSHLPNMQAYSVCASALAHACQQATSIVADHCQEHSLPHPKLAASCHSSRNSPPSAMSFLGTQPLSTQVPPTPPRSSLLIKSLGSSHSPTRAPAVGHALYRLSPAGNAWHGIEYMVSAACTGM